MRHDEWAQLKHFKETDNWGNPEVMSSKLLLALDKFRDAIGMPIIVTCGTTGEHVENSYHYKGLAVDVVFPTLEPGKILDIFLMATRFAAFNGIGIYPDWECRGKKTGGLHLDVRDGPRAYWMGAEIDGKQQYVGVNYESLSKYVFSDTLKPSV